MTDRDQRSIQNRGAKKKAKNRQSTASTYASPTKTPMYQAIHGTRYQRQELIKQIQSEQKRRLICYVSGRAALIDRDDTVGFVDLLHNITPGENLDLLIHTGGGDIDAAEKLISMVRTTVATGQLRVIVPDFAKSAGTLMALGSGLITSSKRWRRGRRRQESSWPICRNG